MTELYEAVSCNETVGVFSTLDKAKAAVEAKIRQEITTGIYGIQYARQNPLPALTWQDQGNGVHVCGFVRMPTGRVPGAVPLWRGCDPAVYTIELDPAELP
jgi:hypothetical protein